MKLNKNKVVFLLAAPCLILFAVWCFWDEYAAPEVAAFQETFDWQTWKNKLPANENPAGLETYDPTVPEETKVSVLIRTDSAKNALLLKLSYADDVFLYDSASKKIRQADENEWTAADGEITRCRAQEASLASTDFEITSYPTYRISLHGKKIETYGKYALRAVKSPSQRNLAILSAYGPVKSAGRIGLVGLGGSAPDVYGQMYVEVKRIDGGENWSTPVRLGRKDFKESYRPCWSADEKFVVIYSPYWEFAVIQTGID